MEKKKKMKKTKKTKKKKNFLSVKDSDILLKFLVIKNLQAINNTTS